MVAAIEIEIGGRVRRLRFSRRTAFRAAQVQDLVGAGGAVALAAMVWALLDEPNPKETPEDIWELIDDDEVESIAEAVTKAWEAGQAQPGKPKRKPRSTSSKSD